MAAFEGAAFLVFAMGEDDDEADDAGEEEEHHLYSCRGFFGGCWVWWCGEFAKVK